MTMQMQVLPPKLAGRDRGCGVAEAAVQLGRSVATVNRMIADGRLASWRTNGRRQVSRASIARLQAEQS